MQPGCKLPKREKARGARYERVDRAELVKQCAWQVAFQSNSVDSGEKVEQRVGCDLLPEGAQFRDPLGRLVSRDNR